MVFTYYCDKIKNDNGEWLVFNVFSGKLICVSNEVHENIIAGNLDKLKDEEKAILIKNGFVVNSHEDDFKRVEEKLLKMKYCDDSLTVTILTNMDCNLGCKYCHENGLKDFKYLKKGEISKINKWLTSQVETNHYKSITIYFYGGEPTLNLEAIEEISVHVGALAEKHGFTYNLSMSTNGTLLNDKIVNRLVNAKVCDIQITLDGPREVHDFRKPFLDGGGSFDIIFNNIKMYYKFLDITIRVNVDKNNYDRIPELMDTIVKNDLHNKAYFYLDLISSTHKKNDYCNNYVLTTKKEMQSIVFLWEEQKKRGIPLHGKNVIEGLCGNLSKSNVTIAASGEFYICPGLCGIKDACFGDIVKGYNSVFDKMMETNVWENCKVCKYLPMCAGGCRAQAYMKSGSCFSCYCKKDYYEDVVMKYIKCKYE